MPIYESICLRCGTVVAYRSKMDDRDVTPPCPKCNDQTERVIVTPPMGFVDTPAAG